MVRSSVLLPVLPASVLICKEQAACSERLECAGAAVESRWIGRFLARRDSWFLQPLIASFPVVPRVEFAAFQMGSVVDIPWVDRRASGGRSKRPDAS